MKKYQIILADPPWQYKDKICNGNCAAHYKTMSMEELFNMGENIRGICDDNCVLFMWGTYPLLPEAIRLIKVWGFKYKTIAFQWLKLNKNSTNMSFLKEKHFFGLGRWTRGNTEPCLLATIGKPKRINNSISQIIESPIRRHSTKPDSVRNKIVELMGDLPRIELFARQKVDGWDCIGNGINGKDIMQELEEMING